MIYTHELTRIPKKIQRRYNIGKTVKIVNDGSVGGGNFTFLNKAGETVSIDAVELSGTNIMVQKI